MGIAAIKQANTNRARFRMLEKQSQQEQSFLETAQDTIKAAEINKLNVKNTQDRLSGASTMQQLRGIAGLPKNKRSGPLSDLKNQMASRGVSITDTIMQTFTKLESEELIPMVNQMSASLMSSGGGQGQIMETITDVTKSIAAVENAHFSAMNPEAAKKQQVDNINKQIAARQQAMTNLIGQPQSAAVVQQSIQNLEKQRARLTGEDRDDFTLARGGQRYSGSTNELLAENTNVAGPSTNVNVNNYDPTSPQDEQTDKFGIKLAEDLVAQRPDVQGAADSIRQNNVAAKLINEGIISGFGANTFLNIGRALRKAGFNADDDDVANTQAYIASQAKAVAQIIKAFGAGTGLSDADREYALKAAGGDIKMDLNALKRIIEINARASKNVIERYNKDASGLKKGRLFADPEVELPEFDGFETIAQPKTEEEAKALKSGTKFMWEGVEYVKD